MLMNRSPAPSWITALTVSLALLSTPTPAAAEEAAPTPVTYRAEILVPGSAMHGVHGLAFDRDDELYGASLAGYSIYRIDRRTGAVSTEVGYPLGNSDDLAFGPDGTLAWTAGAFSAIHARTPDGEFRVLADGLGGVNSINFSSDGRLFFTRIFGGDHLYEIDVAGTHEPRLIAKKLGGLNGFEVTDDNSIIGPLFFKKKVIEVDLETGTTTDVADGFKTPAAVNIDTQGNLYVVDYVSGEVTRIRLADGTRDIVAELEPPLDNLAIDKRGFVYISNPAFNRITELDPETGATRVIVEGQLSTPGALAFDPHGETDRLFIADFWGSRFVDPADGTVTLYQPPQGVTASSSIAVSPHYYALAGIWPFGVVYIVDRATNKLVKRVPISAPYGMSFLADESLLVADYRKGQVVHLAPGKSREKSVLLDGLAGPVGLAVSADEKILYIGEYDSGDIIAYTRASGARTTLMRGLEQPEGIAVDSSGQLIVAEAGLGRIWLLGEHGDPTVIAEDIPTGLAGGDDLPAPFLPTGVAVDPSGHIYISADVANALYRLTPE